MPAFTNVMSYNYHQQLQLASSEHTAVSSHHILFKRK